MAEDKKLLEIQNLRKYFPIKGVKGPGVQAVQDVSLFIKKGETLLTSACCCSNVCSRCRSLSAFLLSVEDVFFFSVTVLPS